VARREIKGIKHAILISSTTIVLTAVVGLCLAGVAIGDSAPKLDQRRTAAAHREGRQRAISAEQATLRAEEQAAGGRSG
jgi:hypothetical protein